MKRSHVIPPSADRDPSQVVAVFTGDDGLPHNVVVSDAALAEGLRAQVEAVQTAIGKVDVKAVDAVAQRGTIETLHAAAVAPIHDAIFVLAEDHSARMAEQLDVAADVAAEASLNG